MLDAAQIESAAAAAAAAAATIYCEARCGTGLHDNSVLPLKPKQDEKEEEEEEVVSH